MVVHPALDVPQAGRYSEWGMMGMGMGKRRERVGYHQHQHHPEMTGPRDLAYIEKRRGPVTRGRGVDT